MARYPWAPRRHKRFTHRNLGSIRTTVRETWEDRGMNADRLDALARSLGMTGSRRNLLGGIFGSAITPSVITSDLGGTKTKKHKMQECASCSLCGDTCCASGESCMGGSCTTPCLGPDCGSFSPACPLFPANNIWNTPVNTLPVDANSAVYVQAIGDDAPLHPDFGSGDLEGGPIGIPFVVASGGDTLVTVSFDYADESDPGPYPIPQTAPVEGGWCGEGDRHILVVDASSPCTLYELYDTHQTNGAWSAGSGAIYDVTTNDLRPAGWTSADAAGLPILPGLVRYDEVLSGVIKHALRFTAPRTRDEYIWPARHFASSDSDPNLPPMGQRFRLKSSVDTSNFSPTNTVILTALQTYGMFLADNGSAWFLSGVPDPRWDNDDLHQLQVQLKGTDFEAIDESALMIDPDSGEAVQ